MIHDSPWAVGVQPAGARALKPTTPYSLPNFLPTSYEVIRQGCEATIPAVALGLRSLACASLRANREQCKVPSCLRTASLAAYDGELLLLRGRRNTSATGLPPVRVHDAPALQVPKRRSWSTLDPGDLQMRAAPACRGLARPHGRAPAFRRMAKGRKPRQSFLPAESTSRCRPRPVQERPNQKGLPPAKTGE